MSADAGSEETAPPPARLLVVDDERGVREGCRRLLTAEGYLVDVAADATEALDLLPAHDYHLALVDMKMPGRDGLALLDAAAPLQLDTVFVAITAYATFGAAMQAARHGAYDFLPKPFTPDDLLAVTARGLDRAALVRERRLLREERTRRLLELRTEQGRLHSVVQAMSDGVIVTNREGQVVLCNAAAAELAGARQAGEARPLGQCVRLPELVALIDEAAAAGGRRGLRRELRYGPEPHHILVASASPVTDEDGSCLGVVTLLSDVSQLKQAELARGQFVNMVAHELRTPLVAVDAQIMTIREGYAADPVQASYLLDRSHVRLQGLLEMVNNLLTLSRLDTDTAVRRPEPVDLVALAAEVCSLQEPLAAERGITLHLQAAPGALPSLPLDRQEARAILANLVGNAVKYNREGGEVRVALRTEESAGRAPLVLLEVADTGRGISAEARERVFEEFYRERAASDRVPGTGLGLAIVQRLVQAYGGTVEVDSEVGAGSAFTVRLPLNQRGASDEQ